MRVGILLRLLIGILLIPSVMTVQAHESHTHSASWAVCESKKVTEPCEYTNGKMDLYKGTCQAFNSALMCVRNQPIIHVESGAATTEKQISEHTTKVD